MPRIHTLPDDVILARAMVFFWQNGYAGTSLRDLTLAAGLRSAELYHRFSDKDGLFVEAFVTITRGLWSVYASPTRRSCALTSIA